MSVKSESERGWISQEVKMTSSSLSTVIVFHLPVTTKSPPRSFRGITPFFFSPALLQIVIPFFSLLIKDLYFLNEGCVNRLKNGHINFEVSWTLKFPTGEFPEQGLLCLLFTATGLPLTCVHFPKVPLPRSLKLLSAAVFPWKDGRDQNWWTFPPVSGHGHTDSVHAADV